MTESTKEDVIGYFSHVLRGAGVQSKGSESLLSIHADMILDAISMLEAQEVESKQRGDFGLECASCGYFHTPKGMLRPDYCGGCGSRTKR